MSPSQTWKKKNEIRKTRKRRRKRSNNFKLSPHRKKNYLLDPLLTKAQEKSLFTCLHEFCTIFFAILSRESYGLKSRQNKEKIVPQFITEIFQKCTEIIDFLGNRLAVEDCRLESIRKEQEFVFWLIILKNTLCWSIRCLFVLQRSNYWFESHQNEKILVLFSLFEEKILTWSPSLGGCGFKSHKNVSLIQEQIWLVATHHGGGGCWIQSHEGPKRRWHFFIISKMPTTFVPCLNSFFEKNKIQLCFLSLGG